MAVLFRVHWLSVTIWGTKEYGLKMWQEWFEGVLGPMQAVGHGGRGFKSLYKALLEAKLYADPIAQAGNEGNPYFGLELPGSACDAVPDKLLQEFVIVLERWEKARITRLDLAWDGTPFTPEQVKEAVELEQMRSYLRREKMLYSVSPYEKREDGRVGTSSLRLGSSQSTRMLRVYDKHGPVRLEMQTRAERADLIARDVLVKLPRLWVDRAIAHLRDYIDFIEQETEKLLPWWLAFVNNQARAMKTVSDARTIELNRMLAWVDNQVSPTLSVLADVVGSQAIEAFVVSGRRKRGQKFNALLKASEKGGKAHGSQEES
ncbi:MAG TPA: replication initiation factor domain-containing protein [Anaerolineales bacterium]|nr:replication initiation factor domain-containing protein [Anaerolineales bacterium]HRQ93378.1 replication initiation factor domain-containing protein [Anaerolineales bacterium]